MSPTPTVTVLVAAHQAAAFVEEAVRSALAQDHPVDCLDVVVVDDGSTDDTAALVARLADEHPSRITLVRQENRGLVAAVNRAAAQAGGRADAVALLDADDVWPPDKISRQLAVLADHPEVGLVYTDMRVIDAAGHELDASWLRTTHPPQGREVGRLLEQNWVTASSILLRGTLAARLFPIPAELAWADWWLAVRAAQLSQLAYLPEPRTGYRFHGANMSLGSSGAVRLRELRGALALQRWFLRRLQAPATDADDLERAWDAFARLAAEALAEGGSPFTRLVEVDDDDRRAAAALGEQARALLTAGEEHAALAAAVRAAACDPTDDAARAVLAAVRAARVDGVGPRPLAGARPVVVTVPGDELVRDPALLGALAGALGDLPHVTLAVDASDADPKEAVRRIGALTAEHGLDGDAGLDILLVTGPLDELGRARLRHGTTARVGLRPGTDEQRPTFAVEELDRLRELVAGDGSLRVGA